MRHMQETIFAPHDPTGPDLAYRDTVEVSGAIDVKQLRRFARKRRSRALGPTVIFYAGVTTPAISAGVAGLTHWGIADVGLSDFWSWYVTALLSAVSGIVWYMIFMRLGSRAAFGRGCETGAKTHVVIDEKGVQINRGHVQTWIDWTGVNDVTISSNYVALIVEDANDILLPVEWFDGRDAMKDAARKICALRPPPFES